MKKTIHTTLLALLLGAWANPVAAQTDFNVVPRPASVQTVEAAPFRLDASTRIYCGKTKAEKRNAQFLQQFLQERTGLTIGYSTLSAKPLEALSRPGDGTTSNRIVLRIDPQVNANTEGYRLEVREHEIVITGASTAGAFYGIQTLRKAFPHRLVNPNNPMLKVENRGETTPATIVEDAPRFAYRGAHLDTSRHFVTPDSVRRFIDMLALHNINRFHWHITDDQGWRLEIKKYPRLTQIGSKRGGTVIGHNSGKYDGIPYGGYYTQKECKALVKYAAERNITIIPEIDLPGHMLGALAAYPELGCTGGPYEVWQRWGVSEDVLCIGNDKTLKFIDDVLKEVTKIFPSEYIHVGGDECPKTAWKTCPKCQARIQAEGLQAANGHTAEERLQSYAIRHAEATLSRLGRKMIGWDETLEGGLAEGATVMSWRGEEGGIEAAKQHHDVIMTPNTYLYFDYYQSLNTESEPDAIGGYLPLQRVYGYEPVSDEMLKEGIDNYIVGVQANCWTEYMPTYRQIEYMELPRLAALAEVQWTARDTKDYDNFLKRTLNLMGLYDEQGYNYALHIYDVLADYGVDTDKRCITATLSTVLPTDVCYTLDDTTPKQYAQTYSEPLEIRQDCQLRAATFRPVEARPGSSARKFAMSNVESQDFTFNKATASPATLTDEPAHRYTFNGAMTLVDGIKGVNTNFQTGQWIGFNGKDMEVTLDLGAETEFSEVGIGTLVGKGDWIFDCTSLSISGSADGKDFSPIASETYPVDGKDDPDGIRQHTLNFSPAKARYVRIKAESVHAIPDWHQGRGIPAFLFVDEVSVK